MSALICEGKDDAATLRARCWIFCEGMNQMITTPVLRINTSDSRAINVEIDLRFSGEFQIIKALNCMSPYTSAIWCECEGACLRAFCAEPLSSWAAVLARWAQGGEAPCK
eukprot:474117-Pleurochrysis_carterae.AAC.1